MNYACGNPFCFASDLTHSAQGLPIRRTYRSAADRREPGQNVTSRTKSSSASAAIFQNTFSCCIAKCALRGNWPDLRRTSSLDVLDMKAGLIPQRILRHRAWKPSNLRRSAVGIQAVLKLYRSFVRTIVWKSSNLRDLGKPACLHTFVKLRKAACACPIRRASSSLRVPSLLMIAPK